MVLLRLFDYQGALTVRYHRQRSFYRRRLFAAYIKAKDAYDQAVSSLQKFLDIRDAKRKDKLWKAVMESEKSYDEILQMIMKSCTDKNEKMPHHPKTLFSVILTKQRF